jgi:hypothetical protein
MLFTWTLQGDDLALQLAADLLEGTDDRSNHAGAAVERSESRGYAAKEGSA